MKKPLDPLNGDPNRLPNKEGRSPFAETTCTHTFDVDNVDNCRLDVELGECPMPDLHRRCSAHGLSTGLAFQTERQLRNRQQHVQSTSGRVDVMVFEATETLKTLSHELLTGLLIAKAVS